MSLTLNLCFSSSPPPKVESASLLGWSRWKCPFCLLSFVWFPRMVDELGDSQGLWWCVWIRDPKSYALGLCEVVCDLGDFFPVLYNKKRIRGPLPLCDLWKIKRLFLFLFLFILRKTTLCYVWGRLGVDPAGPRKQAQKTTGVLNKNLKRRGFPKLISGFGQKVSVAVSLSPRDGKLTQTSGSCKQRSALTGTGAAPCLSCFLSETRCVLEQRLRWRNDWCGPRRLKARTVSLLVRRLLNHEERKRKVPHWLLCVNNQRKPPTSPRPPPPHLPT